MTVTVPCPCCGQQMTVASPADLTKLKLSMMERTIVLRLIKAYPAGIDNARMLEHVYSGAREPDSASNIISVTMTRIRKKLLPAGWTVPADRYGRGNNSIYRLTKIDSGAPEGWRG